MQATSLTILLDYLSNNLLIALIMCSIGSISREVFNSMNNTDSINIKKIILSSVFSSILMSAIYTRFKNINSAIYIFSCFIAGLWGYSLFVLANNTKVAIVFLKHLLKGAKSEIGNAAKDAAEELTEITKEIDKTEDNRED